MRACPGKRQRKAYELSSPLPEAVTIIRVGHPLRGQRLLVERRSGAHRRDGNVQVALPDGSPMLLPISWTDLAACAEPAAVDRPRFDIEGLRRMLRLAGQRGSKRDGEL
jgi:hypothetical protein